MYSEAGIDYALKATKDGMKQMAVGGPLTVLSNLAKLSTASKLAIDIQSMEGTANSFNDNVGELNQLSNPSNGNLFQNILDAAYKVYEGIK